MYNVYDDYDYSDLCASVSGCCAFIAVYDDNGDDNCFDSMIDGDFDSVLIDWIVFGLCIGDDDVVSNVNDSCCPVVVDVVVDLSINNEHGVS